MFRWTQRLIGEAQRRRVPATLVGYSVGSAGLAEATRMGVEALILPTWAFTAIVAVSIVGLPLVLGLAWQYDVVATPTDPPVDGSERARPTIADARVARSRDELRVLYENTSPSQRPCLGCGIEDLDWELVEEYARSEGAEGLSEEETVRALGLTSSVDPSEFTLAAVLCFAKRPDRFHPQARSVFVAGTPDRDDFERIDVLGPLSQQLARLFDLVERGFVRAAPTAARPDGLLRVSREALSNAIVHRDYSLPGHIQVALDYPDLHITSPGSFPSEASWDQMLLESRISVPGDPAIAWYLTSLLAAETVGRGFEVYRKRRLEAGEDTVVGTLLPTGPVVRVSIHATERDRQPAQLESVGSGAPATKMTLGVTAPPNAAQLEEDLAADDEPPLPVEIAGFEVVRLLGEGGAGSVYLARDAMHNRLVAVKTLFQRFGSPIQRERFLREARLLANLRHPGIVDVYSVGSHDDYFYIAMQYVPGPTLRDHLSERGRLAPAEAALLTAKISDALAYAHAEGVVHRDVTPRNVILGDDADVPVLTDFGVAEALQISMSDRPESLTVTGQTVGTPEYMSPEQIRGERVDPRSDIYSLGIVLYEMLSGSRPHMGGSVWKIMANRISEAPEPLPAYVPPELAQICMRAIAAERDARYGSATDFAADLRAWAGTA